MPGSIPDLDALSLEDLKKRVLQLLERVAVLEAENDALRAEVARLKGLKARTKISPSGMDKATEAKPTRSAAKERRDRGAKGIIDEERVIKADVSPGSRFKGDESYTVHDLVLRRCIIRYRWERWRAPAGETIVAPLPPRVHGHFGPEPRRYVLAQYHQGQVTIPRLVTYLNDLGIRISKRQVIRLLNAGS